MSDTGSNLTSTTISSKGYIPLIFKMPQKEKSSRYRTIPTAAKFYHYEWSHLGLNQGLPDYESGALTN